MNENEGMVANFCERSTNNQFHVSLFVMFGEVCMITKNEAVDEQVGPQMNKHFKKQNNLIV